MTVQSARLRVFLLLPDTAPGNACLLCLPWDGDPIQMITLRFGYFLLQLVQVTPGKVQLIFSMLIEAALSVSQAVFISMLSTVRLLIATARIKSSIRMLLCSPPQSGCKTTVSGPDKDFHSISYFRCLTSDLVWYLEWLSVVLAQL